MIDAFMILVAVLATRAGAGAPSWEKLYSHGSAGALGSIIGLDDGAWIAAGGETIVEGSPLGVRVSKQPGRFIVGLGGGGADPIVAVGEDDLVLRRDGAAWIEESFEPGAIKLSKMRRRSLVLQGAVRLRGEPLVAYGPWRVLARVVDGQWRPPAEAERYRLMLLAQAGPSIEVRRGCEARQWRWLAHGAGWLTCGDGRSFVVTAAGALSEKGRLPSECRDELGTVVQLGDRFVVTCGDGGIWRFVAGSWARVPAPKMDALAVAGSCVVGVGPSAVWRTCSGL